MVKSEVSLVTKRDKTWLYDEYYIGNKDEEARRNGRGKNHWTGAESIEWYNGRFTQDTMHGEGDYRWRYLGPDGAFITYEGRFYDNCMHGYGAMSYPNGRVFNGLFYKNVRWGPGVEYHPNLKENVGFWLGHRLIRLTWRPSAPSVAPDFITGQNGQAFVENYRTLLAKTTKVIGETNSALELLKQLGADPLWAAERWTKLYPKHCTDLESQMCHVDVFDHDYYKGKIYSLEEVSEVPDIKESDVDNQEIMEQNLTYFAWNNSESMIKLMKHCYKHEYQRVKNRTNLTNILNGARNRFRPSGKHERDCRTLLMASYLGHITNVARLVNEHNVHPDVADIQGNTALMYATCGEQDSIIHFLVEAGANVNSYNDSCCTPLGVALMRYACAQKDIAPGALLQAFMPLGRPTTTTAPPLREENQVQDWLINRDIPIPVPIIIPRTLSKAGRTPSVKKVKSLVTFKEGVPIAKKKTEYVPQKQSAETEYDSDDSFSEDKRMFSTINEEYTIRVNNVYSAPNGTLPQYLFQVNNMVLDVATQEMNWMAAVATKSEKSLKSPKKGVSRVLKDTVKTSKEAMLPNIEQKEHASIDSFERMKQEWLSKIMVTILQLLSDGADPKLVSCPQPALLTAIIVGSTELIQHLVINGVDVNETYPSVLDYSALDVAISRPFSYQNLELIKVLLEVGADTNHRLKCDESMTTILGPKNPIVFPPNETSVPGPTLLHVLISKQTEFEFEIDIRNSILELLLAYNCSPVAQFNGRSAIDLAMTMKIEVLDIFVQRANAYLNEIINSSNQTILVKMFSTQFFKISSASGIDRFPILTNLLLYGADPLQKCQDGDEKFKNLFEYAKMTFNNDIDKSKSNPMTDGKNKLDASKSAKSKLDTAKSKVENKLKSDKSRSLSTKSMGRIVVDIVNDYKEAVELVTECARLLHMRWLQGKLIIDLIDVIRKFKHRHWNMIIKEHTKKKAVALWLTPQRSLEIWDLLKTTNQKQYKDTQILKHLLCIVQYYQLRIIGTILIDKQMTVAEKNSIESAMGALLMEYKLGHNISQDAEIWKKLYVKPELETKAEEKYNVCFECALPLEYNIKCVSCKMVSFCSSECMRANIDRANCHPCSDFLMAKYFPIPDDSLESPLT